MPKRFPRRHLCGSSNLPKAQKCVDTAEILIKPPVLKFVDPSEQVGRVWKRPTTLYEPPVIQKTKLGGTIVRPESRCNAERVHNVVSSFLDSHENHSFLQKQWSKSQPQMGVSEWQPGEAPRARPIFTMTDDLFVGGV